MTSPALRQTYDLLVLGAGATGLGAARAGLRAGGAARTVALVEGARPGGDCTHYGCVPSKTLLEAARRVAHARGGEWYGFSAAVDVDFAAVTARVRSVIADVERDESPALLARQGIDLVPAFARFVDPHTVETDDGRRVRADRIVLATGGSAAVPPVPGIDGIPYLTNRTVFTLTEQPAHLVVLGGGPIGCELAQAFRRLGSAVTLVEAAPRLLPRDEPEAGAVLADVLIREGVDVRVGATVERVSPGPTLHLADGAGAGSPGGATVAGSHLLLATGRRAETASLDLPAAGVAVDERTGRVRVDEHLRTTQPHVWAAGDCASPYQFTHVGDEQGRLATRNAFARRPGRFSARVIPWTTFTDPEVGRVGLTERQAYEQWGETAQVAYVPMAAMDRPRCAGTTDGFVKLVAAPRIKRLRPNWALELVGATVVAPVGGELVAEAALALRTRMLVGRIAQTVHSYPTWSIAMRYAAAQFFTSYAGGTARPARPD